MPREHRRGARGMLVSRHSRCWRQRTAAHGCHRGTRWSPEQSGNSQELPPGFGPPGCIYPGETAGQCEPPRCPCFQPKPAQTLRRGEVHSAQIRISKCSGISSICAHPGAVLVEMHVHSKAPGPATRTHAPHGRGSATPHGSTQIWTRVASKLQGTNVMPSIVAAATVRPGQAKPRTPVRDSAQV